jgi:hypothetical protein
LALQRPPLGPDQRLAAAVLALRRLESRAAVRAQDHAPARLVLREVSQAALRSVGLHHLSWVRAPAARPVVAQQELADLPL